MNLWMRDMQREDISTRNGRADRLFAPKSFDFRCICLTELAYNSAMSTRHISGRRLSHLTVSYPEAQISR